MDRAIAWSLPSYTSFKSAIVLDEGYPFKSRQDRESIVDISEAEKVAIVPELPMPVWKIPIYRSHSQGFHEVSTSLRSDS